MNTDNKALVEFITKKYLDYAFERNAKLYINSSDKVAIANEYDTKMIQLFWEKIAEFPEYNERNYQAYLIQRQKGLNRGMFGSTSSNPDIDYACRCSGISSDYILGLQREFFYGRK